MIVGPGSSHTQVLELHGVAHRFGRQWVLRGVDLSVAAGEVVALAGGNGAGKTTLLKVAASLLPPMRGSVRVCGIDFHGDRASAVRERVGYLGHSPALYEDLTARENLAFALRMHGLPAGDPDLVRRLDEVGLAPHADVRVRRFSSGMRRRLALARTLLGGPALLLMDEPYASLDSHGVELVNQMVTRVVEEGGGVLMATHDFQAGGRVTHRIMRLDGGRVAPLDPDTAAPLDEGGG
ncbi:MAG: heme ABC exporter ATP-binding protein CcmA [Gemmatimonadota bacterium]